MHIINETLSTISDRYSKPVKENSAAKVPQIRKYVLNLIPSLSQVATERMLLYHAYLLSTIDLRFFTHQQAVLCFINVNSRLCDSEVRPDSMGPYHRVR